MTVLSATPDRENLTLVLVADLAAPPEAVWRLWTDPRRLERWWGPPTWPATFTLLEPAPGGSARYFMTGPDGERAHGWWRFADLDEPRSLEFEDGFADEHGEPAAEPAPSRTRVALDPRGPGTRMTITSSFASAESLEQMLAMGMLEGLTLAVGQMDDLLVPA